MTGRTTRAPASPAARLAGVLVAAACIAACAGGGHDAPLVADDVRVSAPRPGTSMSAGYFTLTNPGREGVQVTRITSPQFERVELHETVLENGISRMRPIDSLVIPPRGTVRFEPGGRHLMLSGRRGDAARTTLEFWSGESLLLRVDAAPADGG